MKRLTAKNWKNSPHLQIEPTTQEEYDSQRLYTRLAELEDKIESGILIELPCELNIGRGLYATLYISQDGDICLSNAHRYNSEYNLRKNIQITP